MLCERFLSGQRNLWEYFHLHNHLFSPIASVVLARFLVLILIESMKCGGLPQFRGP